MLCSVQAPLALLMWRGPEDLSVAAPATAAFAYGEPSVTEAAPSRKAVLAEGQSAAEGQTGADGSQRDPQSSQVCGCGYGVSAVAWQQRLRAGIHEMRIILFPMNFDFSQASAYIIAIYLFTVCLFRLNVGCCTSGAPAGGHVSGVIRGFRAHRAANGALRRPARAVSGQLLGSSAAGAQAAADRVWLLDPGLDGGTGSAVGSVAAAVP